MKARYWYFIYGFLFGSMFPIGAIVFECFSRHIDFSFNCISNIHQINPLIYMIDTAPLFLGFFALIGGVSKEKSDDILKKFRKISTLLVASNQKLDTDSKLIIETLDRSNKLFKKISNDIIWFCGKGQERLEENKNVTDILERGSVGILNDTSGLLVINEEMKNSTIGITEELNSFIPKIKDLYKSLRKVDSIGKEINILSINSGIEAHKYGEGGKSFSVISQEVKGLSDRIKDMNRAMYKLIEESEGHISNLQDYISLNQRALNNVDNVSKSIKGHLDEYGRIIQTVSDSLKDTAELYLNLNRKYELANDEVTRMNNEKDELIGNLQEVIDHEVRMVEEMREIK